MEGEGLLRVRKYGGDGDEEVWRMCCGWGRYGESGYRGVVDEKGV